MTVKHLTRDSIIIALYVFLSLGLNFLSFGLIQIRIAEALMVLCLKDRKYIKLLSLACFLTNVIGVVLAYDVIVFDIITGTLATYLAGYLMYYFKEVKYHDVEYLSIFLACLVNALIVGISITYVLNDWPLVLVNILYVFVGEAISIGLVGQCLKKIIWNLDSM